MSAVWIMAQDVASAQHHANLRYLCSPEIPFIPLNWTSLIHTMVADSSKQLTAF